MDRESLFKQARELPDAPGVYLFKDQAGRDIYVGKAKSLRKRVRQYFDAAPRLDTGVRDTGVLDTGVLDTGVFDEKTRHLVQQIRGIDYVETASEVEAMMLESRMIKDLQPKYNVRLRSNVNFPLVEITWGEDFPRVLVTRDRTHKGSKYYGPFADAAQLRQALRILQRVFKFRSCSQKIAAEDPKRRYARPCLNYYIGRSSAPCSARIEKTAYRAHIRRLSLYLSGRSGELLKQMDRDMKQASQALRFEQAATIRDQIEALRSLERKGDLHDGIEPEVPHVDLREGVGALRTVLGLEADPVTIEGIDISHFQGGETVASVVTFRGGRPERGGYRRFRIKTLEGVDDYAAIREVVRRRYSRLLREGQPLPDLILIDGGKGQLSAAREVLEEVVGFEFRVSSFELENPKPETRNSKPDLIAPASSEIESGEASGRVAESEPSYGRPASPHDAPSPGSADSGPGDPPCGSPLDAGLPFLASLSKQEEIVHTPESPAGIRLPRRNVGLRLLQHVRDEAHRFAQHYHHILRRKRVLDER